MNNSYPGKIFSLFSQKQNIYSMETIKNIKNKTNIIVKRHLFSIEYVIYEEKKRFSGLTALLFICLLLYPTLIPQSTAGLFQRKKTIRVAFIGQQ
jgi:hypothetical protein